MIANHQPDLPIRQASLASGRLNGRPSPLADARPLQLPDASIATARDADGNSARIKPAIAGGDHALAFAQALRADDEIQHRRLHLERAGDQLRRARGLPRQHRAHAAGFAHHRDARGVIIQHQHARRTAPDRDDAADQASLAYDAGCRGILLMPPFYFKDVSDDGLFAAYSEVIERVGDARMRVYLYHFPQMTAVPFGPDLIERLRSRYPEIIAGMKDSSGDLAGITRRLSVAAVVNSSHTPTRVRSLSASRARSRSGACPGISLCEAASASPCSAIWSALNNSDRNGGSASGRVLGLSLPRRRAFSGRR